jgi:hypothetical protein
VKRSAHEHVKHDAVVSSCKRVLVHRCIRSCLLVIRVQNHFTIQVAGRRPSRPNLDQVALPA